ncbi:hypothetical protein ACFVRU_01390 [Streptomyces sp. NPDC057927]
MRLDMGKAAATAVPRTAAEFRRQRAEEKQTAAVQAGCARLFGALALLPVVAFVLMLAVGAVHGFAPAVPAIGYGTTILLTLGADSLAVVTKKFK